MYIKTAEMLPNKFASVFEMSYLLFGKVGYLISCLLFTSLTFGCLILYYLMVSESISSILQKMLVGTSEGDTTQTGTSWALNMTSQTSCILFFSALQLLFTFKRQLEQLKFMSYICTVAIFFYIVLVFADFFFGGKAIDDPDELESVMEYKGPSNLTTGFLICFFTYSG